MFVNVYAFSHTHSHSRFIYAVCKLEEIPKCDSRYICVYIYVRMCVDKAALSRIYICIKMIDIY